MQRGRIAAANLPVELPAVGLVHRFGEQELRAAQPHADRAINKTSLIFLLGGHDRTVSRQAPNPPGKAMPPVAHFVQHPQPHRSARRQRQGRELRRQLRAHAFPSRSYRLLNASFTP